MTSPIIPTTTVRELLSAHPQTASVLLRFGMCADCQADPPPIPLSRFATKHCEGKIDLLLQSLRAVTSAHENEVESGGSGPDPT